MDENLSALRWSGTLPLTASDVSALSTIAARVANAVELPSDHPVYDRVQLTLACEESGDLTAQTLCLLSQLSCAVANRQHVAKVLEASAPQIESFLFRKALDDSAKTSDGAILQCLLLTSDHGLRGHHAVEVFNGNAQRCMRALIELLRTVTYSDPNSDAVGPHVVPLVSRACRVAYELSSYRTFWSTQEAEGSRPVGDKPMLELAGGFEAHMAKINELLAKSDALDVIGLVCHSWYSSIIAEPESALALRLLPTFEEVLTDVLQLLSNTLSYATSFTAQLKRHVTMQTVLLQNVVLPCLLFYLDAAERGMELAGSSARVVTTLVRFLSLVTFNIRAFRQWLHQHPNLGQRLCQYLVPMYSREKVELMSHIVRLVVNAELAESVAWLLLTATTFSPAERICLAQKLSNPRDRLHPMTIFCTTYGQLRQLFDLRSVPIVEATVATDRVVVDSRILHRRRRNKMRRERNRKRFNALRAARRGSEPPVEDCGPNDQTLLLQDAKDSGEENADMDSHSSDNDKETAADEDERLPAPTSATSVSSSWRQNTPVGVPRRYLCALTNQVMLVPVISAYGDTYEKDSILKFIKENGNKCPVTGEDLFATDLVVDSALKRELDVVRYNYV